MVLKKPIRSFRIAFRYWIPKRLTTSHNIGENGYRAPIYAWLWWNFGG